MALKFWSLANSVPWSKLSKAWAKSIKNIPWYSPLRSYDICSCIFLILTIVPSFGTNPVQLLFIQVYILYLSSSLSINFSAIFADVGMIEITLQLSALDGLAELSFLMKTSLDELTGNYSFPFGYKILRICYVIRFLPFSRSSKSKESSQFK